MDLDQNVLAARSSAGVSIGDAIAAPAFGGALGRAVVDPAARAGAVPRTLVGRAPGSLDLFGGMSEYAGVGGLCMPIGGPVTVTATWREDDRITVSTASGGSTNGKPAIGVAWASILDREEVLRSLGSDAREAASADVVCACAILAVVRGALGVGLFSAQRRGIAFVANAANSGLPVSELVAPVACAALAVVGGLLDTAFDPARAAKVVQAVESEWFDRAVGCGGTGCIQSGETSTIHEFQPERGALRTVAHLPSDLAVVAVDSGVLHADAPERLRRVRTASAMGRFLIAKMQAHEGAGKASQNGQLSGVSVAEYVARFRDRLPTKLLGREFVDRFGDSPDPLTRIEPDFVYKVRSRTEHHIYEAVRVREFSDCMLRLSRGAGRGAAVEAGEIMFASHWSYGQRCGLGSIETDALVNLIRQHGASAGIHGAKITGRGCGGLVAVLMRSGEQAPAGLHAALEAYKARTGLEARVLRSEVPGVLVSGASNL